MGGALDYREDDLGIFDSYHDNYSNLNDVERSLLYYISGYVTFKGNIPSDIILADANIQI